MKMIMAVVPRDEAEGVLSALIAAGPAATFTESRGGMLRQAQYTIFVGADEQIVPHVLNIVHDTCHSVVRIERADAEEEGPIFASPVAESASVGGAVIFVWDLEQFAVY